MVKTIKGFKIALESLVSYPVFACGSHLVGHQGFESTLKPYNTIPDAIFIYETYLLILIGWCEFWQLNRPRWFYVFFLMNNHNKLLRLRLINVIYYRNRRWKYGSLSLLTLMINSEFNPRINKLKKQPAILITRTAWHRKSL